MSLHTGVSYRHLLVFRGMDFEVRTYPPHDHIGKPVEKILPRGKGADLLIQLINQSQQLFAGHDVNRVRQDLGENQVSSIWLWGQGKQARLDSFRKRYGLRGAAITAVDLVRGLAKLIGFDLIDVPGATGFIDTNYEGKGQAAIKALEKYDLVFVHIEAPDEAGHEGDAEAKKKAIEQVDKLHRRAGTEGPGAMRELAYPGAAGPPDARPWRRPLGQAGPVCHGRHAGSPASCTWASARRTPPKRDCGSRRDAS